MHLASGLPLWSQGQGIAYNIDVLAEVYSNKKLIMKLFKGARQ
jgi:hypothetical protein